MPTVRISSNWRNPSKMAWAGAPTLNANGTIERAIDIPEEAFQAIEREIAKGAKEGTVILTNQARFDYFVDR
jgi:hypothetical protein